MYVDLLKSPSILSLSLQDDNLDTVGGIKCILKSRKSLMSLAEQAPFQWPMMRLVCARIKKEDEGHVYQVIILTVKRDIYNRLLGFRRNKVNNDYL